MSKNEKTHIVAIIPAHLDSVRFPRKILYPFHNLPMIEHVRRRTLLCNTIARVVVATCDMEIADQVREYGGDVIMTSNKHLTGMTRAAEAVEQIDCSHVLIVYGDEPLLSPQHLDLITSYMVAEPDIDAWNVTGPIYNSEDLNKRSFVKCSVTKKHLILYCYRRSPGFSDLEKQKTYIRKILGLNSFQKSTLLKLADQKPTRIEKAEFIEQMRIIENGYVFRSVPVDHSTSSVNEPDDVNIVLKILENDPNQAKLLKKILTN